MGTADLIGLLVRAALSDPTREGAKALATAPLPESHSWIGDVFALIVSESLPVSIGACGVALSRLDLPAEQVASGLDYLWGLELQGLDQHRGQHGVYLAALANQVERDRIEHSLTHSLEALKNGEISPAEAKGMVEASQLASADDRDFYDSLQDRLTDYWDGGTGQFIPTAWPALNRATGGGWRRGGLNFVVARPGAGKTALVEQDAAFQRKSPDAPKVMYVAIEMEPEDHIARIIRREHYDELFHAGALEFEAVRMRDERRRIVSSCANRVKQLGIRFMSCEDTSAQAIFTQLDRQWRMGKFDILILDYFQLITYDGLGNHSSAALEGLKRSLALILMWTKKKNVATILPAQAKRELDDLSLMPKKSDISDCSEAEKLASNVIFCHANRFVVAKARRGVESVIDVDWVGERLSFQERAPVGFLF